MNRILEGVIRFKQNEFQAHSKIFAELRTRQYPQALFITCADSRVVPSLLTQTRPGDLFICRNAGNIVPAYGEVNGGVSATIEYAVLALEVQDIIVCGHSDCGAMKAVLHPELVADMPNVAQWLRFADSVRLTLKENYAHLDGEALLCAAIQENVRVQLEHLKTHPSVAARIRKGALRLHGWYYQMDTADVSVFDLAQGRFMPVQELSLAGCESPAGEEARRVFSA